MIKLETAEAWSKAGSFTADQRNMTLGDKEALRWLSEKSGWVVAVDTDKNLGLCLAAQESVRKEIAKHLKTCR